MMRTSQTLLVALTLAIPSACGSPGGDGPSGPDGAVDVAQPDGDDGGPDVDDAQDPCTPPCEDADGDTQPTPDADGNTDTTVDTASDTDVDGATDADTDADTDAETADDTGPDGDASPDVDVPPAHECLGDEDCDDGDACTLETCGTGENGLKACAYEALSCDPPGDCIAASCDPEVGCLYEIASTPTCCFQDLLASHGFEDDVPDIAITTTAPDGTPEATWSVSEARAFTGSSSLYFGIPEQMNYANGKLVAADVLLGAVALPAGSRSELNFHLWADVEPGESWDVVIVNVIADGASTPVWVKTYDNVSMETWQRHTVDLGAFAGQTVAIQFSFNSVDHTFNDTEGLYLDDLWLWVGCGSMTCELAANCDDGIPCTADACLDGACTYDTADACCVVDPDCFDADNCTIDVCINFTCENSPVANPECCNTDAECDDNNPCTDDTCAAGIEFLCVHPVSDESGCCETVGNCDDSDGCTIDVCEDFICDHYNTCCFSDEECDDNDDVCTVDSCQGGACVYQIMEIEGCCDPEPWFETFELDLGDWNYAGGGSGCGWQIAKNGQWTSPSAALYYGDPSFKTFNCGDTSGSAQSKQIALQEGVGFAFETQVYMDTEGSSSYDKLFLYIHASNGKYAIWTKPSVSTNVWFSVSSDISAWAGETVSFEWYFDTIDGAFNDGEGVYIDDMLLTSSCVSPQCASKADCSDGLSGTGDGCVNGTCSWTLP